MGKETPPRAGQAPWGEKSVAHGLRGGPSPEQTGPDLWRLRTDSTRKGRGQPWGQWYRGNSGGLVEAGSHPACVL